MYRPIAYDNFGAGLNLRDQPDVVGASEAIDCLNVEFTERGAIKQRGGYAALTSLSGERVTSLSPFYTTSGTRYLMAAGSTTVNVFDALGGAVSSLSGLTAGPYSFSRFGTPNSERVYLGNGYDTLRYYSLATGFLAPTATTDGVGSTTMPKGGLLAVDQSSNRLVVSGFQTTTGGPNNATTSPSHVYFSDPGLPETWQINNYQQLRPGDGEKIIAVVAWRELIFVFKETAFFVFYGESVDVDGNTIFQYRPVDAGVGAVSSRAVVASREGVYFMSRNGVYLTTGDAPKLVSSAVTPIFEGNVGLFFQSDAINHSDLSNAAMTYYRERLYLAVPTGPTEFNNRVLVFDPVYGYWTLYDIPAAAMTPFRSGAREELAFAFSTGSPFVGLHDDRYANDNGQAIASRWCSGWTDFANPDVKTVRESKVWGDGKVSVGLRRDFELGSSTTNVDFTARQDLWGDGTGTDLWGGPGGTDLWGPDGVLTPELVRVAKRATVFATSFENSTLNQSWSVHRLVHHLRETRPPSVRAVDRASSSEAAAA